MNIVEAKKINSLDDCRLEELMQDNRGQITQKRETLYKDLSFLLSSSQNGELFICTVSGDSMVNAGILDGAKIIVEVCHRAKDDDIIVVSVRDQLFVKRLKFFDGKIILRSENDKYPDFEAKSSIELLIWGIVKLIIQKPRSA